MVPVDDGAAAHLSGVVRYLTCNDICVPYDVALDLAVPPGAGDPAPEAHLISRFVSQVPSRATAAGIEIVDATLQTAGEGVLIQVAARAPEAFVAPDLFLEGPDGAYFDAPVVALRPDGRSATITVSAGGLEPAAFAASLYSS